MSQQSLIDAAKASIIAYGNKDWDAVVEMANGKAQSIRQYFDLATLMQQLGVAAS